MEDGTVPASALLLRVNRTMLELASQTTEVHVQSDFDGVYPEQLQPDVRPEPLSVKDAAKSHIATICGSYVGPTVGVLVGTALLGLLVGASVGFLVGRPVG